MCSVFSSRAGAASILASILSRWIPNTRARTEAWMIVPSERRKPPVTRVLWGSGAASEGKTIDAAADVRRSVALVLCRLCTVRARSVWSRLRIHVSHRNMRSAAPIYEASGVS